MGCVALSWSQGAFFYSSERRTMCGPLFLTVAGICLLSVGTCVGFLTAALFAAGAAEQNASGEIRSSPAAAVPENEVRGTSYTRPQLPETAAGPDPVVTGLNPEGRQRRAEQVANRPDASQRGPGRLAW
jgi:hypothetical protein